MKKLIYILGGQASGKMTIGEELVKITGLKLFHNHMTVELANHFFGFDGGPTEEIRNKNKGLFAEMRDKLRQVILEVMAKSGFEGLIMTGCMSYDEPGDFDIMNGYTQQFINAADEKVEVYYVEIDCDLNERLFRNETENRLAKKPSKRNIEWTRKDVEKSALHRLVSTKDDRKKLIAGKWFAINNTSISAIDVAEKVKKEFNL